MKKSVLISLGILLALAVWMASGSIGPAKDEVTHRADPQEQRVRVSVQRLHADQIVQEVIVQGQLEPLRAVVLKAETAGPVVRLPVEKGQRVEANEVLAVLDDEDRPARLAKAEALVASKQMEVEGSIKLQSQRLQTEQHLKAVQAQLAEAEAERAQIQLEIRQTRVRAPFAGVFEEREIEIGSLLQRGDPIGKLIDDATMLAVGQVSQQDAGLLRLGQEVEVRLLDGRSRIGIISFISKVAEPGTRSFKVEARFDNKDARMSAGYSAELRIRTGERTAHFITASALTLDAKGVVGVKSVNAEDRVEFQPIKVMRSEPAGIWVDGLPQEVTLITQGQGFVIEGELVEPVPETQVGTL